MKKCILITSKEKNIGKSLFSVKIAKELSKLGNKVIVVELSQGEKSISEYLDVEEHIIYDVKDVLNKVCESNQAVINLEMGFSLLPVPRLKEKIIEADKALFSELITVLNREYDNIIVEAGEIENFNYVDYSVFDFGIVINNNDYSSLVDINRNLVFLKEEGLSKTAILLNKYDSAKAKIYDALDKRDYDRAFAGIKLFLCSLDKKYSSEKNNVFTSNNEDGLYKVSKNITEYMSEC